MGINKIEAVFVSERAMQNIMAAQKDLEFKRLVAMNSSLTVEEAFNQNKFLIEREKRRNA